MRLRARREPYHAPALWRLARRFDLSACDASYLALALELRVPIACSDGALKSVLTRAGVRLA